MSNSILKDLRVAYECLYDKNGNKRVYTKSSSGVKLNKEKSDILYKLIDNILCNDDVCQYTKEYIRNKYISVKGISEKYNCEDARSVVNKIMYDKRKISKRFGSNFVFDILFTKINTREYEYKLNKEFISKSIYNEYTKEFKLDIREDEISKEYKGNFIDDYGDILRTYSSERMRIINSALNCDSEFVGYFNYIMSSLSDKDSIALKDRNTVLSILRNEKIDNYDFIGDNEEAEDCGVNNDSKVSNNEDEDDDIVM